LCSSTSATVSAEFVSTEEEHGSAVGTRTAREESERELHAFEAALAAMPTGGWW
jgi:hypothetical protein